MNVISSSVPWSFPDSFVPTPLIITVKDNYCWKEDEELKKQFAIALAEGSNPFEAACLVFGKETNKALWASTNWPNDQIITKTKQEYAEANTTKPKKLLDKEEFAARLLEAAEEKIEVNGNCLYVFEGKDRIAAWKLYGETMGYINNKTEINNNNFNTKNNFMEIKFVEPEKKEKEVKTIDNVSIQQEENILENSPIKLKLVG